MSTLRHGRCGAPDGPLGAALASVFVLRTSTVGVQRTPLAFADGTSALRWGGADATRPCRVGEYADCVVAFNATDVSGDAVVPAGSTWRRNPVPRAPWAWRKADGLSSLPLSPPRGPGQNGGKRHKGFWNAAAQEICIQP